MKSCQGRTPNSPGLLTKLSKTLIGCLGPPSIIPSLLPLSQTHFISTFFIIPLIIVTNNPTTLCVSDIIIVHSYTISYFWFHCCRTLSGPALTQNTFFIVLLSIFTCLLHAVPSLVVISSFYISGQLQSCLLQHHHYST